ncbi:hypothetical protein I7I50_04988 [Histoplasma capsulatum G186AR]|uniref:Uncharacterized protein n=1 Tax=Ajellomyces capsulatus TaxID=5037 RepID=A0A8H8D7T3_AJECA|nr:hypothetical protein I7I52_03246 [Histoplasma capsulatum]QSS75745.1 hypothetical protein I7I50_04988 [Histoplasma capsulatum G186AR]
MRRVERLSRQNPSLLPPYQEDMHARSLVIYADLKGTRISHTTSYRVEHDYRLRFASLRHLSFLNVTAKGCPLYRLLM